MPRFEPFRALRYATDDLGPVIAPPYDVLSDAEVDALQQRSPENITVVDVPRGGDDRYERAAEVLRDWRERGVVLTDPEPSFTIYRLRFTDDLGRDRDIAGVLGGLEVLDPGAVSSAEAVPPTRVLPHERTTPKASTDRLDLTRATRANLSPVWGVSLATGLTALLRESGEPIGTVTEDEVTHVVERVTDPERIAAIQAVLAADDVLIADGHHRYGVARTYRDEVRSATGRTDTAAEETLTFVNELVADQLSIAAIHRLYDGIAADELLTALRRRFEVSPAAAPTPDTLRAMERDGYLVLHTAAGTWTLSPRPGAFDDVRTLDGAWLEAALADLPLEVTYQHGLEQVLTAIADGRAAAAVLIRPVGIEEIERTAREGLLMPPKSTFFTPKLKTGLVLRPVD
ncbi:MAG TPA: DUF1015 domain-containing protein [Microlunatus sp.]|nr:DUF1015 domain-containing protein [Microlunatus sp.]